MINKNKIIVASEENNERLDIFLSQKLLLTRSQAQKLIERGLVLVNGETPKKAGDRLHGRDVVEFTKDDFSASTNFEVGKEKIKSLKDYKVEVIFESEDYVVIVKPAGLLVHPTEARESGTLVDYLLKKYPEIKNVGDSAERPGIVHRLDKEASGLLVVARTQKMFKHLKKQFQNHEVGKEYSVLVYGSMGSDQGVIDFDIDRGRDGKMVSRPKTDFLKLKNADKVQPGKKAITEFFVEKSFSRFALLRVIIYTGRTHQIRVHMFAYGHPVVGDVLYFNRHLFKKGDKKLNRLFLHAQKLCFVDLKKKKVCYTSDLPEELKNYLKDLK